MSDQSVTEVPPGEEWFDVVDHENNVIGRELRSVVHRNGLRHRAVHLLVFNRAGELFLQKRSMSKDVAPGLWDSSASGHLDAGEDYAQAVVREAKEEIGITLERVPEELLRVDACPETGHEFVRVYRAASEGPFSLHPEEIESGEWFRLHELEARLARSEGDFAPSFFYLWGRLRASGMSADQPAGK